MWRWYQNEDIGEYYWQTELGICKNNKFTPSGARLLIRVGSLRLNENHATKGTLQELLNTAEKTAFLGDRFRSYIRAGIYQKRAVIQLSCWQSLIIQSWLNILKMRSQLMLE